MSHRETEIDYVLSSPEQAHLQEQFSAMANDVFGKSTEDSSNDVREKRLYNGNYARLSRTVIRSEGEILGDQIELELFVADKLVFDLSVDGEAVGWNEDDDDEDTDDVLRYEGHIYNLASDPDRDALYKIHDLGRLSVNALGETRLETEGFYTFAIDYDETEETLELEQLVASPDELMASDFLRLYDAKQILRNNSSQ